MSVSSVEGGRASGSERSSFLNFKRGFIKIGLGWLGGMQTWLGDLETSGDWTGGGAYPTTAGEGTCSTSGGKWEVALRDGIWHKGGVRYLIRSSLILLVSLHCVVAADFDWLIKGGRIADGTGNPAYFADVGIKDGRILAIGKELKGEAKQVLEAKGLVVAPGFIDVHTHAEGIEKQPLSENFVRMGVTTLVLGNCGGSRIDVAKYFKELEDVLVSPNVATLIGHGTVRGQVMGGSFKRPPTAAELAKMKALVTKAMEEGAVGLSTGLIYLPGTFSETEELVEVTKAIAPFDGIYVSHMRSESGDILKALDELFRIAREAGVRAEISHIKLAGKSAWGQTDKVLAAIETARAEGLDITQDQYMYPASSTGLSSRVPEWAREGGDEKFRERLAVPELRAKIVKEIQESVVKSGNEDLSYVFIAEYRKNKKLNGLNLAQAAQAAKGNTSLDAQIDLLLEITANGGASGVFHSMSEEDLRKYLVHPNTMIASDSGVRVFGEGVPHPRGYGNSARALGEYVREQKILRLEDAVRRMTSLPATTFQLKERGLIREGMKADVVVFDLAKVQDNATFTEPHQYATGFKLVLVNGEAVVKDDHHTQARPGKMLRHEGKK
ncbi:MAG: N-acyl-D-aspartate/D-glutamate deacylase [Verrucomicrobia bacterium]|nr:N-acyl-D-aspartate/D-glutamate deacylase [Verrucomicrobiota bacterium]